MRACFVAICLMISSFSFAGGFGEKNAKTAVNEEMTYMMAKNLAYKFNYRKMKFNKVFKNPDLLVKQFKNKSDAKYFANLRRKIKANPIPIKRRFQKNEYVVMIGPVKMWVSAISGYRGITYFNGKPFKYDKKLSYQKNMNKLSVFLDKKGILKKTAFNFLDLLMDKAHASDGKYHDMLKLHINGEFAPALSLNVGFSFFEDTDPQLMVELLKDFKKDVNEFHDDTCNSNNKGWGRNVDNNGVGTHRILEKDAMDVASKLAVGDKLDKRRVFVDLLGKYASDTDDDAEEGSCGNIDSEEDPCGCLLKPFEKHALIGRHVQLAGGGGMVEQVCKKFDEAYSCLDDAYSSSKTVYDRYGESVPMSVEIEGTSQLGQSTLSK